MSKRLILNRDDVKIGQTFVHEKQLYVALEIEDLQDNCVSVLAEKAFQCEWRDPTMPVLKEVSFIRKDLLQIGQVVEHEGNLVVIKAVDVIPTYGQYDGYEIKCLAAVLQMK